MNIFSLVLLAAVISAPFLFVLANNLDDEDNQEWLESLKRPIRLWDKPNVSVVRVSDFECLAIETTEKKFKEFFDRLGGYWTDEDVGPGFVLAETFGEDIQYFEILAILRKI